MKKEKKNTWIFTFRFMKSSHIVGPYQVLSKPIFRGIETKWLVIWTAESYI